MIEIIKKMNEKRIILVAAKSTISWWTRPQVAGARHTMTAADAADRSGVAAGRRPFLTNFGQIIHNLFTRLHFF
jgi:hypothetical protein